VKSLPPKEGEKALIVSLTSFPLRIGKIWMVVECILRQKMLPNKIVLTLSKSQFPNDLRDLPTRLVRFAEKRILTIEFVEEDLRSHKKYYYTFQKYKNDIVVLLDDDIIYPSTLLSDLYSYHIKNPDCIIAHRCYDVSKETGSKISPYKKWNYSRDYGVPLGKLFHTSGAGTLYVPRWFDSELFNEDVFKELCMYADDVWLNIHAQRNSIKTVKTSYNSLLLPVLRYKDIKLKSFNREGEGNDLQLKNLVDYYGLEDQKLFN